MLSIAAKDSLPVYMIHWNAPHWAASAARSIMGSGDVNVKLTVIDNVSERSGELVGWLPKGTRVIRSSRNGGYAGGANMALRDWLAESDGPEFCAIVAHDLHVTPDAFQEMLALLRTGPELGVVGPVIWQHEPKGIFPDASQLRELEWATGACLMLRRSAVEGIFFDENFGSYVEDVDFCLRVADAGHKIGLATRAVAWELGSASPAAGVAVKANTIRLGTKRRGLKGFVVAFIILVSWALRFGVAACLVWRPKERRVASWRECCECFLALAAVANPVFWGHALPRT